MSFDERIIDKEGNVAGKVEGNSELRHHYRARNWTFDENHFLISS